jgi:hypothetical protein
MGQSLSHAAEDVRGSSEQKKIECQGSVPGGSCLRMPGMSSAMTMARRRISTTIFGRPGGQEELTFPENDEHAARKEGD